MFDYKVTKAGADRTNVHFFVFNTFFPSFYSNVEALVRLCNTVSRIGVSLFHTQTVCESNQPA